MLQYELQKQLKDLACRQHQCQGSLCELRSVVPIDGVGERLMLVVGDVAVEGVIFRTGVASTLVTPLPSTGDRVRRVRREKTPRFDSH